MTSNDKYSAGFGIHYTLAYVLAALRNIVNDFGPEHRAADSNGGSGCIYTNVVNGALVPVCIVGQFFAREGLLRALLHNPESMLSQAAMDSSPDQYGACEFGDSLWDRLATFGITADEDAIKFLRQVQYQQDNGAREWGPSLEKGIENFRNEKVRNMEDEHRSALGALNDDLENTFG